jgi:LysM repeat protein
MIYLKFHHRLTVGLVALALLLQPWASRSIAAQGVTWTRPVNLSLSGAASAPQLVGGEGEALYAYWWDQFDGLTVSSLDANGWGAPQPVPISDISYDAGGQPNVSQETGLIVRVTVRTPGTLAGDNAGRVNAFFLGTTAAAQRPLRQSSAAIGEAAWSEPRTIAPGASAWRSVTGPDGAVHLAIMYPGRAAGRQPGIYYMRSDDGGVTWGDLVPVAESLYVRMATQTGTHMQLVPAEDGRLFLTWNEPGTNRALYSWSWDGGASWARPRLVDPNDRTATQAQVALGADGVALMLWQGTTSAGEQALMMRRSEDGGWNWTAPERVLTGLRAQGAQVALQSLPNGGVLLAAGEQADGPALAAWRPAAPDGSAAAGWSSILTLPYPVRDLDALVATGVARWQARLHGDHELALIGADGGGDVWLLGARLSELTWAYPESPAWLEQTQRPDAGWAAPVQLASSGVVAMRAADEPLPVAQQPTAPPVETPPVPTELRHVVEVGDSLSAIAARYGVSPTEIAAANGITQTNIVRVGQELIIPGQAAEPAPEAEPEATPEIGADLGAQLQRAATTLEARPQIVAGRDGQLQALWWDAFEGFTSAWFDGAAWLQPQRAGAFVLPDQQSWLPPLGAEFLSDDAGRVHAFWLESEPVEPGAQDRTLRHNSLTLGAHTWGEPTLVASLVAWRIAVGRDGALLLLYTRPAAGGAPAGLYIRSLSPGEEGWSEPILLREWAPETPLAGDNARLALAVDGDKVYAAWDDAEMDELLWARSEDGGQTWSTPASVGAPDLGPRWPLLAALSGDALLLFQATAGAEAGSLHQVRINTNGQIVGSTEAVLPEIVAPLPEGGRITLQALDGQTALLLSGVGGQTLTVATWHRDRALDPLDDGWSAPQSFGFGPEGPVGGSEGTWQHLEAVLSAGRFTVLGLGPESDLWTISREAADEGWAEIAPPTWSGAVRIGEMRAEDRDIAVLSDGQGRVHVMWSASQTEGGPGLALWYARYADGRWTQPGALIRPQEGVAEHPSLALVGERLHAVWSGGTGGQIQYAASFAADAYAAASWPQPTWLPTPSTERDVVAAHPQIRADLAGRLHVVYAVPINQTRGIYYTRSDDGGLTWSPALPAFDAAAEGWAMVGEPTLAVGQNGVLYVAWLRMSLVGTARPQALYLARSIDGGATWSAPKLIAEGDLMTPELLVAGAEEVHLIWQEASAGYGVWHSYTRDGGDEWSLPMRVRGLARLGGYAGAASDGMGLVYLTSVQPDASGRTQLLQATWESANEQWRLEEPYLLPWSVQSASGAWVALEPLLGNLEVVLQAEVAHDEGAQTELLHTRRQVSPRQALPAPAPGLIATPTPQATPTAQPTPTVRPTVNIEAPPEGEGAIEVGTFTVPLLSIGGVLVVALLVIGVLVARGARRR